MLRAQVMIGKIITSLLLAAILVLGTLSISFLTVSPAFGQALSREERNWEFTNGDKFGLNYNPQNILNKDNVQHLELKWIYPIPSSAQLGGGNFNGFGDNVAEGTTAPVLIVDGVVYTILNRKTVIALDAGSGEVVWTSEHPGADNDVNSVQSGGIYPITPEAAHTHGLNYWNGVLWFTDWGCKQTGLDAETGEIVQALEDQCLEIPLDSPLGVGIAGNSGLYGSLQPHPPMIWEAENLIFYSQGGASEGTWGGRNYLSARDLTTGELRWRTFLVPPCGDPTTCGPGTDGGPLFLQERAEWGQMLVDNCDKIWIQQIKACDINQDILRNDWGDMRINNGVSNIWGQLAIDEETGIVYFGTAQPGPDWNATYRPGPNLFGSSIMALDGRTGDLVWAHQSTTHDLWDYDCSWNTILSEAQINDQTEKVIIKGCKNGIVYVLDAATGEAYHTFESPDIMRCEWCELLNPLSVADMTKPWSNYPSTDAFFMNCFAAGCLESDIAYDPERNMVYAGTYNNPSWSKVGNADARGVSLAGDFAGAGTPPYTPKLNSTISAWDLNTGQLRWSFFIEGIGFRGGVIVSGGVVWFSAVDGLSRGLDADTGVVLYEQNVGAGATVQPSMGADSDGNMLLIRPLGVGLIGAFAGWQGLASGSGAIMAWGLPDVIPEPEIVEVEVPGPERVVEVEVPGPERVVERIVEVPVEVEIQTISPISYVAIGLGVVLIVISGVLFTRKRST